MTETRTYRLASNVRFFFAIFGIFFLVVIAMIVSTLVRQGWGPEAAVFVTWLVLALAFFSYGGFRGIIAITLEDGGVTFRSLLQSVHLPAAALVSVETSWWDINRFSPIIRHRGGTLRLAGPFDGFYELVTRLKELNPGIEVKRL